MIIEKIQHYLSLTFVIALIVVQSLVFVMTRADVFPGLLVEFIEPSNTSIYQGEIIDLQASLNGLSTEALGQLGLDESITCSDLNIIDYNFVLKDTDSEDIIFFTGDSVYDNVACLLESSASWDTSEYAIGDYYLAIQANIESVSRANYSSIEFIIGCNDVEAQNYEIGAFGCNENDVYDYSCCEYETEGAGTTNIYFESELFQISIVMLEYTGDINIEYEEDILLVDITLEDIGVLPESIELVADNSIDEYNIVLTSSIDNLFNYYSEEINTSEWSSGIYTISTASDNLNIIGDNSFTIILEGDTDDNTGSGTSGDVDFQPPTTVYDNTIDIELEIESEENILTILTDLIDDVEYIILDILYDGSDFENITLEISEDGNNLISNTDISGWYVGEYTINLSDDQNTTEDIEFNLIGNNTFTIEAEDGEEPRYAGPLEIDDISFTIIEPVNISGETFSNNIYFDISSSETLENDINISLSLFLLNSNGEELQEAIILERAAINNRFYTDLDIEDYINGEYRLNISAIRGSEVVNINDYIFYINNNQSIVLNSPIENSIITTLNFIVGITTNFSAESLFLEFINEDEAITTGEIEISSDGQGNHWIRTIELNPDIFYINTAQGNYSLIISAINEDGEHVERIFNLVLDIVGTGNENEEGDDQEEGTPEGDDQEEGTSEGDDQEEGTPGGDDQEEGTPEGEEYEEGTPEGEEYEEGTPGGDDQEEGTPEGEEYEEGTPEGEEYEEGTPEGDDQVCIDQGILNEETCLEYLAMINENISEECMEQEIYNNEACEDYLNLIYTMNECEEHDPPIIDPEECNNYLLEVYSSNINCNLEDQSLCNEIIDNNLSYLVIEQNNQDLITEIIDLLIGQVIEVSDLNEELEDGGVDNILPIEEGTIYLANSQKEIILEDEGTLTILNKAVIILDDDGDGLSNDLEEYYGTDKNNKDSDNDGYFDGQEILNNYNPLGEGMLDIERLDFDKIILNDLLLEQPKKKSNKIVEYLNVDNIDNNNDNLILSGTAEANTWVNIYLYSKLPLVMLTKTDESGNWSYTIKKSLVDGEHKAYVTVNDDTGKIVKQSNGLSFLIKSAKAVSAADYFDSSTTQDRTDYMVLYYILGTIFLILLSLGVILYLHKEKVE